MTQGDKVYLPKVGEVVRVIEIDRDDGHPSHAVGDEVLISIQPEYRDHRQLCIYLDERNGNRTGNGTFCRVESVSYASKPAASTGLAGAISLALAFAQLGPRAQAALVRIAERLVTGTQHGDFDGEGRNWLIEAREEAFDMAVYLSVVLDGEGGER